MAEFDYKAVTRDEYKTGVVTAESEGAAETVLTEQGLKVISLKLRQPAALGFLTQFSAQLEGGGRPRMSAGEKILFTGQLASMVKAGLPLVDALMAFVEQGSGKGTNRIINNLVQEVQSGSKFSDSLARQEKIFPPAYIAVVKAGENSGTLADSLAYLSVQLRRENELVNKVRSALIYPVVVVVAMIAVMLFMTVAVVPKIITFAASTGQKLPVYTVALVNVVNFTVTYWYLVLVAGGLAAAGLYAYAKSTNGARFIGQLTLKIPVVNKMTRNYNLARFARALGGFYLYGVNIIASFDILASSLEQPLYKESCMRIKKRLTMGQTLADAIAQERDLYPSIMVRLIKGAEKTGELGATLDKLAAYYEDELEISLRNVVALIEPALIFILGFGVLGLAMTVVVPIYKVTSTLK